MRTVRSAYPFVAGQYGADNFCAMPFICRKCLNSFVVNCGSISETHSSSRPIEANKNFSLISIVPVSGIFVKQKISGHFEKESTTTSQFWLYRVVRRNLCEQVAMIFAHMAMSLQVHVRLLVCFDYTKCMILICAQCQHQFWATRCMI